MVWPLVTSFLLIVRQFISVLDDTNVQDAVKILIDAIVEGRGPSLFETKDTRSDIIMLGNEGCKEESEGDCVCLL